MQLVYFLIKRHEYVNKEKRIFLFKHLFYLILIFVIFEELQSKQYGCILLQ